MDSDKKYKILKKLLDNELIEETDLKNSNKSLIDEIKEDMHNEFKNNIQVMQNLELENILMDNQILTIE